VFVLKPGESRSISESVGAPPLTAVGRYRLALRYINNPNHYSLREPPSAEEGKLFFTEVIRSTPVTTVSNAVEVVVVE
jgi:hypothetical protein